MNSTTRADAQYVHDEWDRRTRAHDIDALLDLYTPEAVLESPLVPWIIISTSGVLTGHRQLREFFERGTRGRPNALVRFYRTGQFLFEKGGWCGSTPGTHPTATRWTSPR